MKSFLLYHHDRAGSSPEPESVTREFGAVFRSLFAEPPEIQVRSSTAATLMWFALPVEGWKPSYVEEDDERWVLAIDYPLNARSTLTRHGISFREGNVLTALSRALEERPESLLKDLAPPFSLITQHRRTGEFTFVNDALGQAQAFSLGDPSPNALTNRVLALKALGCPLRPDTHEWATRLTLGWFPLATTGYHGVRHVQGGSRFRFHVGGVDADRHDVLGSWVHPAPMSPSDCHEMARESVLEMIREAMPLWTNPTLGLSGGWDSRALGACLRSLDADFSARVRGNPRRLDVILSHRLAAVADFPLRLKFGSGLPPDSAEECRQAISRSLVWQAGALPMRKHKTFLSKHRSLRPGVVNITGQHAGFGKADFAVKIGANHLPPAAYESRLIDTVMNDAPPFIRKELRDPIRDTVTHAYRAAERYDLDGLGPLHFFFLNEYTRRWAASATEAQTSLTFAPFLSPDFIRASYAYPAHELPTKPFHRFITDTLAPDWAGIPYTDQVTAKEVAAGKFPPVPVAARKHSEWDADHRWKSSRPHRKYHYKFYWKDVALPLLEEALSANDFAHSLFDLGPEFEDWRFADDLVIAHLLPEVLRSPATLGG